MREFQSLTLRETAERLKEPKNTLITCHVKPDGDCLGSAFALKAILRELGSRAWVVCAEECPHRLSFILDGEQTSVLCTSIPADFSAERIVAVDTASPGQAGALFDLFGDRYDLSIDHHGKGTPFSDHCILPNASATGEILFTLSRMLLEDGSLREIPKDADRAIYTSISSDTGCFKYNNTTPEAHHAAAELIRRGVPTAEINGRLFSSVPYLQMQTEYEGFRRLRFFEEGRIAVIPFPYEAKTELGIRDEHTETLIDVARVVEGVEIAFVVKQPNPEPIFRVSMRSSIDFDVSEICAVFGGGGHTRAAGATVKTAASVDETVELVLAEIRKRL